MNSILRGLVAFGLRALDITTFSGHNSSIPFTVRRQTQQTSKLTGRIVLGKTLHAQLTPQHIWADAPHPIRIAIGAASHPNGVVNLMHRARQPISFFKQLRRRLHKVRLRRRLHQGH